MKQFEPGGEEPPIPGLSGLKRDQAPQRDLWTGIDSRISAQRIRRQRAPWQAAVGIAASALLVLSAVVGVQSLRTPQQTLGWPAPLVSPPQPVPVRDSMLLPATARMHPETRALVKANLKIVDSAENQLKRALAADPDGAYLKSLLDTARQQKEQLHVVLADAR